jgi:hypothetical protein
MYYKLLGFSQDGSVRRFSFHRIAIGEPPIPFSVIADTAIARRLNIPLQELPSLCSRMVSSTTPDTLAGPLTLGEAEMAACAAELAAAKAQAEAARQLRFARNTPATPNPAPDQPESKA